MNVEQARFNMIEQQVRPWNVLDAHVLDLLAVVRREDFVPPAHRALAFADLEIPLKSSDAAIAAGQVMLAPRLEARMLQDLQVAKHEKVLEIGAGSGFMAALLGHRAQRVLTLEIDEELAHMAHGNLQRAGVMNVEVRVADGASADLSADGPFDVIVLSGSVAQLPDALLTVSVASTVWSLSLASALPGTDTLQVLPVTVAV
jgi:protein-L-isoaspartate(D-aspartate) O-methyltransferase